MGKLTKASFAAAKRRLGIKKVTKKNIGRIAKAARKGGATKRRSTRRVSPKRRNNPRRKSNPKGGNKRMGKRSTTIPLAVVGGVFGAPAVRAGISKIFKGDLKGAMGEAGRIAGATSSGFNAKVAMENIMPILVGIGIHKVASKLGVNRALGRAKIPLIRI